MNRIAILTLFLAVIQTAAFATAPPLGAFEGRRLFNSHCLLCHGPEGRGDGPLAKKLGLAPADLKVTVRSRSNTILKKIISGEGGQTITGRDRHNLVTESMPEWGNVFTEDQIEAIIAYMRFMGRSKHPLAGDPEIGQNLYRKYCLICHGDEGMGDGIMAGLMNLYPRDLSNPVLLDARSNGELRTAILDGTGEYMPGWRDLLDEQEVDGLISYIRLLGQ